MFKPLRIKPLAASVAGALALVAASGAAHALEAKISGQVNRAIFHVDDGIDSETLFVDNNNSSTRFRFTGSEDIGPGLKGGIVWEVEYKSNDAGAITIIPGGTNFKSVNNPTFNERKVELYFQGPFGQVTLGQGDGAVNGGTEVDLSGTSVVSFAGITFIGAAISFRQTGGGVGPTVGSQLSNQDFESRYDRVRYDSPALGPVKIAVSQGTSGGLDVTELGVQFNQNLGAGGKLSLALGFSTKEVTLTNDQETTGGSISWLHPMGWNVTVAHSNVENDVSRDSDFNYVKLGYKTGKHAVSVDYAQGDDQTLPGDKGQHKGVQYVYSASKAVELYGGFRTLSLDRTVGTFQDIDSLMVGSRIKF